MTWRDGVNYWRRWARQGGDVSADDATRMSRFYQEMRHCKNLDDEMPTGLAAELKMTGASTND